MRGRIDITCDIAPPPDWWAALFARRQRRLRTLALRHLSAEPGQWLSTTQVRSAVDRYEAEELEHALGSLADEGVIEWRVRVESQYGAHGRPVERAYWRVPAEGPGPCPA